MCGEIGLRLVDFYEMTPRQFQNYFEGYADVKAAAQKESWFQTRWLAFYAAAGHLKKGTTPDKLLVFPWEIQVEENNGIPTQKEIDDVKAYWAERDSKK